MNQERDNLKESYEKMKNAELNLWDFERHIRLTVIEDMLNQSNTQKVQLVFERQAQRGENAETWRELHKQMHNAEIEYTKSKWDYEVELERLKNE